MKIRLILTSGLVVLLTLISHAGFSQIRYIKLSYICTVKAENNSVKVTVHEKQGPAKSTDREITISSEQFQKLVTAVQEIKPEDVMAGPEPSLLDGSSCSISYGNFETSVSYGADAPDHNTDKRKLKGFLKAFELILETAKLDPKVILN